MGVIGGEGRQLRLDGAHSARFCRQSAVKTLLNHKASARTIFIAHLPVACRQKCLFYAFRAILLKSAFVVGKLNLYLFYYKHLTNKKAIF
jgi:hypothetical protein